MSISSFPASIFDFSVASHQQEAEKVANSVPVDRLLSGIEILVVEDNLFNQEIAQELLTQSGAKVTVADNGLEAVNAIKQSPDKFNLVLMDVQMPVMDGMAATQEIRRLFPDKKLPIIAMTANAMVEDKNAAIQAGMDDHIGKPFEIAKLAQLILHWCKSKQHQAKPTNPQPVHSDNPRVQELILLGQKYGLDVSTALSRLGGNWKMYVRLLNNFSEEMRSKREKLLMVKQTGDLQALSFIVHSIKGISGTVGAQSVYSSALEIDQQCKKGNLDQVDMEMLNRLEEQMQAISLSSVDYQQLFNQLEIPIQSTVVNRDNLRSDFEKLSNLLSASSMSALNQFEILRADYFTHFPDQMIELAGLIERLDFETAKDLCTRIIQEQTTISD